MAGIAYNSEVVVYNRTGMALGTETVWYGIRLSRVRIELQQGANIANTGRTDADVCTFKVYDTDLPVSYVLPMKWAEMTDKLSAVTFSPDTIILVVDKADIGASADAPAGALNDSDYNGGFYEYLESSFGHAYRVTTADHYSLIPHWVIGAR